MFVCVFEGEKKEEKDREGVIRERLFCFCPIRLYYWRILALSCYFQMQDNYVVVSDSIWKSMLYLLFRM